MDITEIDKSFDVRSHNNEKNMAFHNALEPVFSLYGVMPPDEETPRYHRLPKAVAYATNDGVKGLYTHTAGGRIRFATDSPCLAVSARLNGFSKMSHMALSGSGGFDVMYSLEGDATEQYGGSVIPTYEVEGIYGGYVYFPTKEMRYITVEFPLYSGVDELYIGIKDDCALLPGREYKHKLPFVTYGSSITQGGCAANPNGSYQSLLSNLLDADYINLGFSGSARGEEAISRHLANMPMSVFILDYDHNAPTAEHLQNTHEPLFRMFREAQPDTPVIMMNRPRFHLTEDEVRRRDIIRATFDKAVAAGDTNVYYIDMSEHFEPVFGEVALVDGCHPNNLGFYYMAKAVAPVLAKLLK